MHANEQTNETSQEGGYVDSIFSDIGTIDKSLCNERSLERSSFASSREREREMTLYTVRAHALEIPPKPSAGRIRRMGASEDSPFFKRDVASLARAADAWRRGREKGGGDESLGPRRQRGRGRRRKDVYRVFAALLRDVVVRTSHAYADMRMYVTKAH